MILLSSSLLVSADDNQCNGYDVFQSEGTLVHVCLTSQELVRENGCSAPTKTVGGLYNYYFLEACNAHDRCYNTLGVRKEYCDEQFHTDLTSAAGDNIGLQSLAELAYKVVEVSYEADLSYQADQDWASKNLGNNAYQALQNDYEIIPYSSSLYYQEYQQWAGEMEIHMDIMEIFQNSQH